MKTPEARVKDEIKKYLKSIGAYSFWPVQTGYGSATVDCLACINGRFVAIEVKAPGKKPTERQHSILNQIMCAGGEAWWSDDASEIIRLLSEL